jgi:hypothetical protein
MMHGEIIPREDLASDQFKALGQAIDRWCTTRSNTRQAMVVVR